MPHTPSPPQPLSPDRTAALGTLCERMGIDLLIVFGSLVKGRLHPHSDVDLAVQMPHGVQASKLDLIFELGGIFDPLPVDLVVLTRDTDPLLLKEIFFHGQPVYEKTNGLFLHGKLRAWKLYLDTAPIRQRQKTYIREFLKRHAHVS